MGAFFKGIVSYHGGKRKANLRADFKSGAQKLGTVEKGDIPGIWGSTETGGRRVWCHDYHIQLIVKIFQGF